MTKSLPHIFLGTVSDLYQLLVRGDAEDLLVSAFLSGYGESPSSNEVKSWLVSLPELLVQLTAASLSSYPIVLEYGPPMITQRIDVILFGGDGDRLRCLIIELKQWSRAKIIGTSHSLVTVDSDPRLHPSLQAADYAAKIRSCHSMAETLTLFSCAYLHSFVAEDLNRSLRSDRFKSILERSPVFGSGEEDQLRSFLRIAVGSRPGDHHQVQSFLNGIWKPSRELISEISKMQKETLQKGENVLLDRGLGLSEIQEITVGRIERAIREKKKRLLVVQGGPGSGKTLVALSATMRAIGGGESVSLGYLNSTLRAVLSAIFEKISPGMGSIFHPVAARSSSSLTTTQQTFNGVIIDEAQRLSRKMIGKILSRSDVFIVFLDEKQRVLPEEEGTVSTYTEIAQRQGFLVHAPIDLPGDFRSSGGKAYVESLDRLIYDDARGPRNLEWKSRYLFQIFDNVESLRDHLARLRDREGCQVCFVASFTRSNGRGDAERIRWEKPTIRWRMGNEYIPFWNEAASNSLLECASPYGCQGLERGYVGVLWGKDLAIRNGQWVIHPDHDITDDRLIECLSGKGSKKVLEVLKNRYRILLTRGRSGTLVHFEDEETREFFSSQLGKPR